MPQKRSESWWRKDIVLADIDSLSTGFLKNRLSSDAVRGMTDPLELLPRNLRNAPRIHRTVSIPRQGWRHRGSRVCRARIRPAHSRWLKSKPPATRGGIFILEKYYCPTILSSCCIFWLKDSFKLFISLASLFIFWIRFWTSWES